MKKIVVVDKIGEHYEPYDRKYILDQVAGYCYRNPSILRNAGMATVKSVSCVCFEIDELTEAKWKFLRNGIGSWAVDLKVLPDDWETTIMYHSEFKK